MKTKITIVKNERHFLQFYTKVTTNKKALLYSTKIENERCFLQFYSKIKTKLIKKSFILLIQQGNKEYQKKLNDDAIESYTQALQYSTKNSEAMALAFANRS